MTLVGELVFLYRQQTEKQSEYGIETMNNFGFFATYTGMLNVASRRDAAAPAPQPRRAKRSLAARLFRFA